MQLHQIIILWLSLGVTAVTMDLLRPEHRKEYSGMNLFHALGMMILFILIGGLAFSMALSDYIEYRKRLKRKPEVIKYLRDIIELSKIKLNMDDKLFTESLYFVKHVNYGMITDSEYERLQKIVNAYKLENELKNTFRNPIEHANK